MKKSFLLVLVHFFLAVGTASAEIYVDNIRLTTTQIEPGQWFSFQFVYHGTSYFASSYHHVYLLSPTGDLEAYIDRIDLYVDGSGLRVPPGATQTKSMRMPSDVSYAGNRAIRIYSSLSATPPHLNGVFHYTADSYNTISVTSPPNLKPFAPTGWAKPLIVSAVTNSTESQTVFTTSDTVYVSFAIANSGLQNAGAFTIRLSVDGVAVFEWSQSYLLSECFSYIRDVPLPSKFHSGSHTITITADPYNTVSESSESDNAVSHSISVNCAVNLTPAALPGWSSPMLVSTESGAISNAVSIYDTDELYLSFAIANMGTAAAPPFSARAYVDNQCVGDFFTIDDTMRDGTAAVTDYAIGMLSAGQHVFYVLVDPTNAVEETLESDNICSNVITVLHRNQPPSISRIDDQITEINTAMPPLTFEIDDLETPPDSLSLTFSSTDTGVLPVANISQVGTGRSRTLYLSPIADKLGSSLVTVTVADEEGLTINTSFQVSIKGSTVQEWRQQYFGSAANSGCGADTADPDGDGQNNEFEFVAGVDPTNACSHFNFRIEPEPSSNGRFQLCADPVFDDRTYTILSSTDLSSPNWTALFDCTVIDSDRKRTIIDQEMIGPRKFYRILISRP